LIGNGRGESPAAASVANQKNTAPHAHSAIAQHGSDPFDPSNPFNPYLEIVDACVMRACPKRQQPLGLAQAF
jgi:hypothetical protein